jgi:hypothetical protein
MSRYGKDSEKKKKLIDDFLKSDLRVGEVVKISAEYLKDNPYSGFTNYDSYQIVGIEGDVVSVIKHRSDRKETPKKITIKDIGDRNHVWDVGSDPFNRKFRDSVTPVAFSLDSIAYSLELIEKRRDKPVVMSGNVIAEAGWNPFVIIERDGKKRIRYYQREFCWTLEQEQLLIESIYRGIQCGSILVRLRKWSTLEKLSAEGITGLAFRDIVDGKQRLNAIKRFLNNEFKDLHDNYFSDLSHHAQHDFLNHQLFNYAEMQEDSTDEEVLYQFLKMNHEGVPQSKEHLNYVANLIRIISMHDNEN